jgi:uncharacterized protein
VIAKEVAAGNLRLLPVLSNAASVWMVNYCRSQHADKQIQHIERELQGSLMSVALEALVPSPALADCCHRNHIRRLSIFGSALLDDFRPDSDIDLLVEFEPGNVPGYIGLGTIELQLSDLFNGHPIDLHTPGSLNAAFREQVLAHAQALFNGPAG